MRNFNKSAKITIATCIALLLGGSAAFADGGAHVHIGHVISEWTDTPSNAGLLPTAKKEVIVAAAHANYAKKASDDLDSMQFHSTHVRHAIDPALEPGGGPGLGYGFLKAANGAIEHITLASESADASESVKTHTVHIVSALNNAVARNNLALVEAEAILAATTAEEAAPHALKMAELTEGAFLGVDANGDGKVTWHEGEGGVKAAEKHMNFIVSDEGL
jgi:hypothetical protein